MLAVEYTTKFKKDLKLAKKRNKDLKALARGC
jgi:mRNA-degrading endonuclease YafQ of YafQ-DinJ toxin-antitoxin module